MQGSGQRDLGSNRSYVVLQVDDESVDGGYQGLVNMNGLVG